MTTLQDIFNRRCVTQLCHMTTIESLLSILDNNCGILATDFIDEDKLIKIDQDRRDNRTDYISLSIQYPNLWYFYKKRNEQNYKKYKWGVIFIDPKICDYYTLFSPFNAATECGHHLNSGEYALSKCFEDELYNPIRGTRHRENNLLKCCPTDEQAEVMIYHEIPVDYFLGIAFATKEIAQIFVNEANKRNISYPDLYIFPELSASPHVLSTKIRNGKRANIQRLNI